MLYFPKAICISLNLQASICFNPALKKPPSGVKLLQEWSNPNAGALKSPSLEPGTISWDMQSMSGLLEKGIFHVYGEIHPLGMLALRIKKEIRLKLCGNLHVLGRYRYLLNPHILLPISRHEKGLKWNVVKKPVKLSHTKPNLEVHCCVSHLP